MACDILYRNKRISEEFFKGTIASKLKQKAISTPNLDKETLTLLERLKYKTGVNYELYSSSLDSRAGYTVLVEGVPRVYINTNKVRKDTPIHEYFHIFLESAVKENPVILNNLINLVDSIIDKKPTERTSAENKIVQIKEELLTNPKFGGTELNELGYKELITEVVGQQATKRLNIPSESSANQNIISFIKGLLNRIQSLIKEVLGLPNKSKLVISSNSTIEDIANYFTDEVISGKDSFSYLKNTKVEGVLAQEADQGLDDDAKSKDKDKDKKDTVYKGDISKIHEDNDSDTAKFFNKFFTRDMEVSQDMLDNLANYDADDPASRNKTNKITVDAIDITERGQTESKPGWRVSYFTAYGKRKTETFTDKGERDKKLKEIKDELIKEIPEASKTFGQRMVKLFNDVSKAVTSGSSIREILDDAPGNLDKNFLAKAIQGQDGKILSGTFYTYSEFISKFGDKYKVPGMDDNIIIFKDDVNAKFSLFSLATIPSEMSGPKVTNSFGVELYTSNQQALNDGLTMNKTLKTKRSMLAGLLSLKIREVEPAAQFHTFKYFDLFSPQNSLDVIPIDEVLLNLKVLNSKLDSLPNTDPEIKEVKRLFNEIKPLVQEQPPIEIDYVETLFGHLNRTYTDQNKYSKYYDELLSFSKGKIDDEPNMKHNLAGAIENKMMVLMQLYPSDHQDRTTPQGKEFYLLAQAYYQLKSVEFGVDMRTINAEMNMDIFDQWVKGQGDHFRPELNFFFRRLNRQLNAVKELYREGYMKRKNKAFEAYINSTNLTTAQKAGEVLFDVQEAKYANLFKKQIAYEYDELKDQYKLDANGNKIEVEVHSMELKNLDDASLAPHEKKLVATVAEEISKAVQKVFLSRIDSGVLDKELELEGRKSHQLSKEEKETLFFQWEEKNFDARRDSGGQLIDVGNYRFLPGMKRDFLASLSEGKGINKFSNALINWFNSNYDMENATLHTKDAASSVSNMGMLENFKIGKEGNRLPSLGLRQLSDGNIVVTDKAMNQSISKDLQGSVDFFVFKLLKISKDKEMAAIYHAARAAILANKIGNDAENSIEMKTLVGMFDLLVRNKMQEIKLGRGFTDANKLISGGTKIASTGMLAFNLGASFTAFMGAHGAAFTSSLSRQYGNKMFGVKDLMSANAFVFNPKNMKFVSQLVDLVGLTNNNEADLMFNKNIKAGTSGIGVLKGLFSGRQSMSLMGIGDLTAKATLLIAQLKHDGIFDNFAQDQDGNLYYDWDKEFKNPSKNPDRSTIVKGVLDELEKDGRYKNEKGNFVVPYSDTMMATLDTITGQLFGPFSDTQKGFYQTNAVAKGVFQFKSYIIARANRYVSKGAVNTNISWMEADTDGTIRKNFLYQQGFLNTALYYIEQVMLTKNPKEAWINLRPEQKKNLIKLGIDLAVFATAYVAYYSLEWFDEDDEFKLSKVNPWHYHVESAIFDFVGVYNPKDYLDAIATPVSIVYAQRLAGALYNSLQWDFITGTKEVLQRGLLTTGAGKSADKLFSIGADLAGIEEEISPFRV